MRYVWGLIMRDLQRNKRTIWYANHIRDETVTDEFGNDTGETVPVYTDPVALQINISAATGEAAAEASEIFSRCPVCGRLVCDRCFLICEDLDMCIACAKTLQVRGDIVAGEAFAPRELPAGPLGKASTEESDIK